MTDPAYALRFISGKYQGGEYPLQAAGEVVVGRSSELDMVLVEDMVSRKHARITMQDAEIWIEDLGSTNGTFVNGRRVAGSQRLDLVLGGVLRRQEQHRALEPLLSQPPADLDALHVGEHPVEDDQIRLVLGDRGQAFAAGRGLVDLVALREGSQVARVLAAAQSPAVGTGQDFYLLSLQYGIDDAWPLSFFHHESDYGKTGEARVTLSIGNSRCITTRRP